MIPMRFYLEKLRQTDAEMAPLVEQALASVRRRPDGASVEITVRRDTSGMIYATSEGAHPIFVAHSDLGAVMAALKVEVAAALSPTPSADAN